MGLPEGHVTGVKISRNDMLKALGNGVVPQQAAAATAMWLRNTEAAEDRYAADLYHATLAKIRGTA